VYGNLPYTVRSKVFKRKWAIQININLLTYLRFTSSVISSRVRSSGYLIPSFVRDPLLPLSTDSFRSALKTRLFRSAMGHVAHFRDVSVMRCTIYYYYYYYCYCYSLFDCIERETADVWETQVEIAETTTAGDDDNKVDRRATTTTTTRRWNPTAISGRFGVSAARGINSKFIDSVLRVIWRHIEIIVVLLLRSRCILIGEFQSKWWNNMAVQSALWNKPWVE